MSTFAQKIEELVTHELADAISARDARRLASAMEILIRSAAIVCVCGVGRSDQTLSDLLEAASQHLFEEGARIQAGVEALHAQEGGGE